MEKIDRSFLGIGWSFPPTFRCKNDRYGIDRLHEEDAVRSSLHIILSTITGERVMLPTFGANLQPYVFEPMNVPNVELIKKLVHDALVYHEPRIIVDSVEATPDQANGVLLLDIAYRIIATNTRYNYVYPFYVNEATNIAT